MSEKLHWWQRSANFPSAVGATQQRCSPLMPCRDSSWRPRALDGARRGQSRGDAVAAVAGRGDMGTSRSWGKRAMAPGELAASARRSGWSLAVSHQSVPLEVLQRAPRGQLRTPRGVPGAGARGKGVNVSPQLSMLARVGTQLPWRPPRVRSWFGGIVAAAKHLGRDSEKLSGGGEAASTKDKEGKGTSRHICASAACWGGQQRAAQARRRAWHLPALPMPDLRLLLPLPSAALEGLGGISGGKASPRLWQQAQDLWQPAQALQTAFDSEGERRLSSFSHREAKAEKGN